MALELTLSVDERPSAVVRGGRADMRRVTRASTGMPLKSEVSLVGEGAGGIVKVESMVSSRAAGETDVGVAGVDVAGSMAMRMRVVIER